MALVVFHVHLVDETVEIDQVGLLLLSVGVAAHTLQHASIIARVVRDVVVVAFAASRSLMSQRGVTLVARTATAFTL